jgi:hypothetical protein
MTHFCDVALEMNILALIGISCHKHLGGEVNMSSEQDILDSLKAIRSHTRHEQAHRAGKRYTRQQRLDILSAVEISSSLASVCRAFDVSSSTVRSWQRKYPITKLKRSRS